MTGILAVKSSQIKVFSHFTSAKNQTKSFGIRIFYLTGKSAESKTDVMKNSTHFWVEFLAWGIGNGTWERYGRYPIPNTPRDGATIPLHQLVG